MPKFVKVGPLTYRMQEVTEEMLGDGVMGHESFRTGTISILATLEPVFKQESLWHELLHIIAEQHNIDLNEGQIDALATGVMQVIQDNPDLLGLDDDPDAYKVKF